MRLRFFVFCLIASLGSNSVFSSTVQAVAHDSSESLKTHRWEVVDILFDVKTSAARPFEIDFSARFEGEAERPLTIQGFYDGGKRYVIRFRAPEAGVWRYHVESSHSELNGLSGVVNVGEAQDGRRGAIEIDREDPRAFRFENGDPYYPIAFECDWLFALDMENPQGIPRTRKFVDYVANNGFNQVILNVFAYDVNWARDPSLPARYDFGKPKMYPFGGDNKSPIHSTLNIEYFQRLDRVIAELDESQVAAHLMIYVWNKQVNWPAAESAEDNRYFDYVVKRYQAFPNLIWDISKEALGYGHNDVNYITRRIERLKALDAYRSLVTVHDYYYCKKFPEMVDFVSIQTWKSELYGVMRDLYERHNDKPVLNIEHGGYEGGPYHVFKGSYLSPEACLERAYQCVFAGTYPTHYWQDSSWNVLIYDAEDLPANDRPKFEYYRHLADLCERYDVGALSPDEKRCNSGFCLSNGKDLYLFYVPRVTNVMHVKVPKGTEGRLDTTWFDPFEGTFSKGESKEIESFNTFDVPEEGHFSILIVEVDA